MERDVTWRIISDYIGVGHFVLGTGTAVVGTPYGLQCLSRPPDRHTHWKANLGSRCLGVRRTDDGMYLATCRRGIFLVTPDGAIRSKKEFPHSAVHEAVAFDGGSRGDDLVGGGFREGFAVTIRTVLEFHPAWEGGPAWSYDLKRSMGRGVKVARPIDVFLCGEFLVGGFVDYDSGIGRALVFDRKGRLVWQSEPGPLSELFPVGEDSFLWCLTGYGKFESHLTRCDGRELWHVQVAGVGARRPDGSIAMIVGSNEAPKWDHWEYCQITADGRVQAAVRVKGRVPARPCCLEDGTVYFIGSVYVIDPTSSRAEYTSFLRMPQELRFQQQLGVQPVLPEYDVCVQKVERPGAKPEIIHQVEGSFSLSQPRIVGDEVLFCDGPDIVAVEK